MSVIVRRPSDVLDAQIETIRWLGTTVGRNYTEGFAESFSMKNGGFQLRGGLADYYRERINQSETIFVRANIVDRLWGHAKKWTPDWGLHPDDLPFHDGYVWLEKPIYGYDIHGTLCSCRVITWSAHPQCILVSLYNDRLDPLDELTQKLDSKEPGRSEWEPRTPLYHIQPWPWGDRPRANHEVLLGQYAEYLGVDSVDDLPDITKQSIEDTELFFSFMASLWEFMQEKLPPIHHPDRSGRKRAERLSLVPEVRIVQLREQNTKYKELSDSPEEVAWSHRWRVREHKRHWVDRDGNARVTTVSSYIKGPESLPLIEKDSVYNVKR